jgi:hypothetical protein
MLHAYFYTICLVFHYTSWHLYAFSRTNLLTGCHSASSLFSAVFVFQKSYTGNILGIWRNQSQSSRYFTELPEHRRGDGVGPEGGHTTRGRGPLLARAGLWCGPPRSTSDAASSPIKTPRRENLNTWSLFQNTSRSAAAVDPKIGEGNRHRRSSSSPCLPLARWVSSLPWTMGP